MAITKTNETLMLLKGSRANLASMDVNPGAIYFTTDYPGIYVDLAAEGTRGQSGYKPARRLRMGDVTVVENLAVLQGLVQGLASGADGLTTPDGTSEFTGEKSPATAPILTDKSLYYAIAENVLCMYDYAGKRFVWINDHTELKTAISNLSTAINGSGGLSERLTTAEGAIEDIEEAIGNASSDTAASDTIYGKIKAVDAKIGTTTDASTDGTVYGAINDIQAQIDEITGGEDGSIGDLQDKIEELAEADVTLENTINKVYGDTTNGVPATPTATVLSNADAISQINTKLGTNFETNAQVNKIESVSVKIAGGSELATQTGKAVTVTLPKTLASYDGDGVITDINSSIQTAENTINKVYHGNTAAPAGGYTASVTGNAQAISDLKGTAATANTVLGNAKAISDLKGTAATANTVLGNAKAISDLKGTSSDTTTGTVLGNAVAIDSVQQSVANIGSAVIVTGKADKEGTATGYIDTVRKIALAQAKDYVDSELNSKIAAVNAMAFKGAVNAITSLPKGEGTNAKVNAGDTYVVSADISVNGVATYHIGDLFIATSDQGALATYPQTIVTPDSTTTGWFWVKTGYDSHFEPSLDTKTSSSSVDPTITLQSHVGSDLGKIKLVDTSNNIQITTTAKTGTTPAQISFNLVWATF